MSSVYRLRPAQSRYIHASRKSQIMARGVNSSAKSRGVKYALSLSLSNLILKVSSHCFSPKLGRCDIKTHKSSAPGTLSNCSIPTAGLNHSTLVSVYLHNRFQLRLRKTKIVDRSKPQKQRIRQSRTNAVHQSTASAAEVVAHGVACCDGLMVAE